MDCLIFPGQGARRPGMGADLFARYPDETRAAADLLGYPVADLFLSDPGDRLAGTRHTQPATFLVNALSWPATGRRHDWVAGHGLGEFNALVAAGVLDLMDGLALVQARAELMDGCADGATVAVLGLPADRVAATLRNIGLDLVFVADHDSDDRVTVAGDRGQLILAVRALRVAGARRVLPVPVSGPFHTPLMASAGQRFTERLRRYEFRAGHTPVMSSITGEPFRPARAVELLSRQISGPIEWVRAVRALRAAGVESFHEVNGGTLTAFIDRIPAEPAEERVPAGRGVPWRG